MYIESGEACWCCSNVCVFKADHLELNELLGDSSLEMTVFPLLAAINCL